MDPSNSKYKILTADDLKQAAANPAHEIHLQRTNNEKNKNFEFKSFVEKIDRKDLFNWLNENANKVE